MNKKILLTLLLIVTIIAIVFLPNDKKRILSNLDALAEYCSSASGEKAIALLKKGALAAKLCKNPCMVQIPFRDIQRDYARKELTDQIIMMKKIMPETNFGFHDTGITFPEKTRAELTTTLKLTGKINNDHFTDAYELSIHTEKIDGDWLFSSFSVIEFIEQ